LKTKDLLILKTTYKDNRFLTLEDRHDLENDSYYERCSREQDLYHKEMGKLVPEIDARFGGREGAQEALALYKDVIKKWTSML